jgi:hypothetical protein
MATLIKEGRVAADTWSRLSVRDDGSLPEIPASG